MREFRFNKKVWLRWVCTLGLLLAAFAHQPSSYAGEDIDLSAYTLPDGSLPSFCLNGFDEDGHKVEIPCEFCRISGGIILPSEVNSIWLRCNRQTESSRPVQSTKQIKQVFLPSAPLRGPPTA